MRTLSVKELIGLYGFGLLGFLLFVFGVGLIHRAWIYLAILFTTGTLPPDFLLIPFIQGHLHGPAALHDIGIFLASLGIIVLYIVYFVWLLPLGTPERSRRGFQYILGFLLVFAAWIGIWICMHRAFIFLLIGIEIVNLSPATLHLFGLILVYLFLFGTFLVIIFKAYRLYIAAYTVSDSKVSQLTSTTDSPIATGSVAYPIPQIQIQKDWKFYFLAFLPYFSAAFAVWILLFEGIIARIFGIPIIWALLPWIPWTSNYYMLFGGGLLLASMLMLWGIIVFIRRAPITGTPVDSWWWQGARRYLFVFLTIVIIISLIGGLLGISWTYLSLDTLPIATALFWQQTSEVSILLGLIMAFIIIVGERASEV